MRIRKSEKAETRTRGKKDKMRVNEGEKREGKEGKRNGEEDGRRKWEK